VRLNEEVVTRDGFTPEGLAILQMLFANGAARVESLRTVWAFTKSIGTGQPAEIWKPGVRVTNLPGAWIPDFGDGKWIGVRASDGDQFPASAEPGPREFTLEIGKLFGARGCFSLYWAADDNAEWSIGPGGSITGETTGVPESFLASQGAPRAIEGTFEANSVLKVKVTNSALPWDPKAPNPTGLIVAGSAGASPIREVRPDTSLPPYQDPPRLRLEPGPSPTAQPKISLTLPNPGGRELKPPFHPELQEELTYLVAYFKGEPSDALIRCLRFAMGVQYAEKIPVVELKLAPDGAASASSAGLPTFKLAQAQDKPLAEDKPLKVITMDYHKTIGLESLPAIDNLAILDGEYGSAAGYVTHGQLVCAAAFSCLRSSVQLRYLVVTEPDFDLMDKFRNPSRYFSALRDVRKNKFTPAIRVVNLSRGSTDYTMLEQQEMDAMEAADIVVVAAAGQYNMGLKVDFPAALDTIVSVGGAASPGTTPYPRSDSKTPWIAWPESNSDFDVNKWQLRKNLTAVDVVGPAVELGLRGKEATGTSFAAPIVAALCAAIRSAYSGLKAPVIRKILRDTAKNPGGEVKKPAKEYGSGMIDWAGALADAPKRK
jgi:hypothetical protein